MKLMSLEEAQARSLSANHPVHRERQRENSLPDTSSATLYHTVIDVDSKWDSRPYVHVFPHLLGHRFYIHRHLFFFFPYQEEVVWKIKEVEVHLQPGPLGGFKGKTEP